MDRAVSLRDRCGRHDGRSPSQDRVSVSQGRHLRLGNFRRSGVGPDRQHDSGLVYGYEYTANNRLSELRVNEGDSGSGVTDVSGFGPLVKATYPSSGSSTDRVFYPSTVERVRTTGNTSMPSNQDEIETTWFEYGFHSNDAIAFKKIAIEAELVAENGPNTGSQKYTHVELYNAAGQSVWSYAADTAATYHGYDAATGAMTSWCVTHRSAAGPGMGRSVRGSFG